MRLPPLNIDLKYEIVSPEDLIT